MSPSARTTRKQIQADRQRIKTHLNLYAVLQNLEELVRLDEQAAEIVRQWDVSVQFTVHRGPAAYLEFSDGECRHGRGRRAAANVSLYFVSPRRLNAMFDGRAIPIPLKGFRRLGWLSREFNRLTDRLESCLRPENGTVASQAFTRLRTTLLLQTAAFASAELATLEPTCRQVAARMADGVLGIEVLPEGPGLHAVVSGGMFRVVKHPAESPTAKMTFRDMDTAAAILENRLDSFQALAEGSLAVAGQIQMIDDFALILDRVEGFLT